MAPVSAEAPASCDPPTTTTTAAAADVAVPPPPQPDDGAANNHQTPSFATTPLPEKFNVWDAVGRALQPILRAGVACPPPIKLVPEAHNKARLPPLPPLPPLPETPKERLDAELARLSRSARTWRALTPVQRAALLDATLRTLLAQLPHLAESTARLRGTGEMGEGEDWASLVPVVMALTDFRAALRAGGRPRPLALWRRRRTALEVAADEGGMTGGAGAAAAATATAAPGDGGGSDQHHHQWVAKVFPEGMTAIMYPGFSGEVWLTPGAAPTQGRVYREQEEQARRQQQSGGGDQHQQQKEDGAALVLGAGNQLAVACMDVLHKLVVDDETVLLKFNPVNERAGPLVEKALAPLADFIGYAYGGADVGRYLTRHALVRSIHLTGSAQTYNAIAWGDPRGPAAFAAKGGGANADAAAAPLPAPKPPPDSPLARGVPVGAELGNVTPYVIVPGGDWTDDDLARHADSVVSGLTNNCGHNCLAAEVLVVDARWPLRARFLEAVRARLARSWRRAPYYPGSAAKVAAFRAAFPDAEELGRVMMTPAGGGGGGGDGGGGGAASSSSSSAAAAVVPWLLKAGLTADQARVSDENWCGVLQEVALTYEDDKGGAVRGGGGESGGGGAPMPPNVPAFLRAAADFCNRRCWGTLAASVFVHPSVERSHARDLDAFLGCLRYGSIAVNCPALGAFAVASLGWGAFAAAGTPADIGTGNCVVHNTFLFDHVQKSVLRAPWRTAPAQLWSASQANLAGAVPAAARFLDAQGDGRPLAALAWVSLAAWRAVRGTAGRTC